MKLRNFAFVPLLACLLAVTACNRGGDDTTGQGLAESVGDSITERMANKSIPLGGDQTGLPRAEFTAAGEFLIAGENIPLDDAQRALVMDYRQQLAGIAESGAKVGLEGAAMASTAVTELAKAAFSGDMDAAEKRIEAQAETIEASARLLCERLPLLMASERRLADAVPQFAPYARLSEQDINDCMDEVAQR